MGKELIEAFVREVASDSTNLQEFADRIDRSYLTARKYKIRYDLPIPDGRVGKDRSTDLTRQRNQDIWHRRFVLSETYQSIADVYNISRQRALVIAKREEAKRVANEV